MARKTTTIDGGKLSEIRNFLLHLVAGNPSSPSEGQIWYDTVAHAPKYQDNSGPQTFGGTTPDADGSTKGKVQLAGDLAGTAASPQIAAGVIVNADVNASAAIALSKLATDPLARANHTGTQLAATVSDFDTQVRTSRLDQMASPTADVAMNSRKLTGLADGVSAQDAATIAQLSAAITGMNWHSVRAATTANITISTALNSGDTLDGVTLANGDLVLVKDQSAPAENGVYVVAASPSRVSWMDTATEIDGKAVQVEDGTVNAGRMYYTVSEVTALGTDAITWTKIFSPADLISLTTGVTGTLPIANGGTGQTAAKAARETGLGAAGYYNTETHSAGATITITQATHGLRASKGLIVDTYDVASGDRRTDDVNVASNGDVVITFSASQSANSIGVTIVG